jgi:protein-S-isoprenylcysteine O-methyltransferase Ste14
MFKKLELKIPPVFVTFIFFLAAWLISKLFGFFNYNFLILKILSILLFIAGLTILVIAVSKFQIEKTTVDPITPRKANSLVVNGIYKYTRNPMYLSLFFWVTGLAFYLGNPLNLFTSILFLLYMTRFQIKPEEKILTEKFAEEYKLYLKNVKRWL